MSEREASRQPGITVHCRLRNEERFIRPALLSVLPLAERVLVYDTGSTDATLERVASIQSDKITIIHKPPASPRGLAEYRNEMIERTHTGWFMLVDGDEMYPAQAVQGIAQAIRAVPPTIHRIEVNRRHFIGSFNFVSPVDGVGRIYRTSKIRHGMASPAMTGRVGHEVPHLMDEPFTPWQRFSMRFPRDIFFFHCQYLVRSSKDAELGRLRGWRRPPLLVLPYFGPWPETLTELDGVAHRMTPELFAHWVRVNATLIRTRCRNPLPPPGLWRLKRWPPKSLVVLGGPSVSSSTPSPTQASTVMFLETSLRIGGTEAVLARLIQRLDRNRFRPIVCCLYEPGTLGKQLRETGVPVYHGLAAHRVDLRVGLRLLRLLRQERVDALFIVNQPLTQFWGTWCSLVARVPVRISAIRSTGRINRSSRQRWVNRLTFPWMTRVTALSQTHKAYLMERERVVPEKLEIVPNGVDLSRFPVGEEAGLLRRAVGLSDGQPVVGIVAMLRPEKAHEVFLRSAACVLEQIPAARFLIVGDGPQRPRLEILAKTLGIDARVQWLGVRLDVPALVSLFDVAVLSSHPVVETVSNAILEYMAAGKPIVATRVGSLPELVEDGRTGFLVEPGDWKAMAERVVRLLRDHPLASRMGEAGQDKVRQQFTVERMVQQYEALFERLLNGAVRR